MPLTDTYGLLAAFADADALVTATQRARTAGYERLEAFTPYPMPEVVAALGFKRNGVATVFFIGGLVGGCSGFFMMYWASVIDYPLNIGGRPLDSWPAFIPITFELTVLISALTGFIGLFLLCRLPRYHHPLFHSDRFTAHSADEFFLCVRADDPQYDTVHAFLTGLSPLEVEEVPS